MISYENGVFHLATDKTSYIIGNFYSITYIEIEYLFFDI